jgi:hypothetical protein
MAFINDGGFTGELKTVFRDTVNFLDPYYYFDTPSGLPYLFRRRGRGVEVLVKNTVAFEFDNSLGSQGLLVITNNTSALGNGSSFEYQYKYIKPEQFLGFANTIFRLPDDVNEPYESLLISNPEILLDIQDNISGSPTTVINLLSFPYFSALGGARCDLSNIGMSYTSIPSGGYGISAVIIEEGEEFLYRRLFGTSSDFFLVENSTTNKLLEVVRGRLDGQVLRFKTQQYRDNEEVTSDCQFIEFRNLGIYPCTIDDRYLSPGETFRLDTLSLNNQFKIGNVFRLKFNTEANIDLTRISSQL